MKRSLNTVLIFSGILLLNSCVERYWPDVGTKYEKLLVVDGMISNQPGPCFIQLSYSSLLRYDEVEPVQGCEVIISDNTGNLETLFEFEPGVYKTSNPDVQGIVGRQYKLVIYTPDEKIYESPFQELKEAVRIDTVYAHLEKRHSPETTYDLAGFQFYVSSEIAPEDTNYFFWKLEQTYEYNANYTANQMFDGQYHHVTYPAFNYTCWKTESITKIFTYNTSRLSEARIQDLPLHYVTTETKELSKKYSVLVKQLTLSKEAYNYWNSLQEQIEGQGSLYDKQPYQIRGNMVNVNDPNEAVLGYFFAAGSDEKRIFVDRPTGVHFHFSTTCGYVTEGLRNALYQARSQWPVYLMRIYSEGGSPGALALPNNQSCVDCRKSGGSVMKPAFWED